MKIEFLYFLCAMAIVAIFWQPLNTLGSFAYARLHPVVGSFYAFDWKQGEQGLWSARVVGSKLIDSCQYKPGQIVTGVALYPNETIAREVLVSFIDDDTPDSNRVAGVQYFGRWQLGIPNLPLETEVRVSVRHTCLGRSGDTNSLLQPSFIVGRDTRPND